jgi:hypothetical protein
MAIIERTAIDAAQAATLADAKFADAHEVETLLRRRIRGEHAPPAFGVYELRSPLDAQALLGIQDAARVQFSTPFSASDIAALAAFLRDRPHVELRVHGFRRGFDAALLEPCAALRSLTLDVRRLQHAHALQSLTNLRALRIGALKTDLTFLSALRDLERLELRGTRADLDPLLQIPSLRHLVLENTAPVDLRMLAHRAGLTTLVLAHGAYDLEAVGALEALRALELHTLDAPALPDFQTLPKLERLHLHALSRVSDLRPLTRVRSLRELRIRAMPHLNVSDFVPLQACAELRELHVDLGSRRKEREIHRLIMHGNT